MARIPNVIGRYRVVRALGQGGMGAVYLARDPEIDRLVAIKLIREGADEDRAQLRARFAKEARAVGQLRHVNIVTIFELGEHQGEPFIAMEYIEGQTLGQLIRALPPLPLTRRVEIIEAVCAGLHHAHLKGIVHRDIKPANVMVDLEGSVKVLDFGIARGPTSHTTASGGLVGTLSYMSPEQLDGTTIDARSDVFSLGAVLYEVISGKAAFPGDFQNGLLSRLLTATHKPILSECPDLDRGVAEIVNRALERDPACRYGDMDTLRRDLAAWRQRSLVATTGPDATVRVPRDPLRPPPQTPAGKPPHAAEFEELMQLRKERISSHLDEAHAALAQEQFERALDACRQVLIIDPEEREARNLQEQARVGLQRRQIQQWLSEASGQLDRGALTAATALVERVLVLRPSMPEALGVREAIADARNKLEEQARRVRAQRDAVEQAQRHLRAGDLALAAQAANQAFELDPSDQATIDVQEAIAARIEALEREERLREAHQAVSDARRSFSEGRYDHAIELLRQHRPVDTVVSEALDSLELELSDIRRREEARRLADDRKTVELEATRRREIARQKIPEAVRNRLAQAPAAIDADVPAPVEIRVPEEAKARRSWVTGLGAVVGVGLLAAAWIFWPRPSPTPSLLDAKPTPIAVGPTEPLVKGPDNQGGPAAGKTENGRGAQESSAPEKSARPNEGSLGGVPGPATPAPATQRDPPQGPAAGNVAVQNRLRRGQQHLQGDRLAEARDEFQQARALDPRNSTVLRELTRTDSLIARRVGGWIQEAEAAQNSGTYCGFEKAIGLYTQVLALDSRHVMAQTRRASLQARQTKTGETREANGLPALRCDGGG